MRIPIFDCHVHMDVRSANDYELMAVAGVERVLIPCDFTGEKRSDALAYAHFYERLLKLEHERASAYGITACVALAFNTEDMKEADVSKAVESMSQFFRHPVVVAVGELTFREFTPKEINAFKGQLRLAHAYSVPVLIKAPRDDRDAGLRRALDVVEDAISEYGVDRHRIVWFDLYPDNIEIALNHDLGGYGIPVSPVLDSLLVIHQKVDPRSAREMIRRYGSHRLLFNSGLHFGFGDPLALPRVLLQLRGQGVPKEDLERGFYQNARELFG